MTKKTHMATTYTLQNDFHHTEVRVRTTGLQHIHGEVTLRLSRNQIKRAKRELCGIDDCTCSGEVGTRGKQVADSGNRIILDCSRLSIT